MSIKVMSEVWARADCSGGDLLVLLALADHADDSGRCWPSLDTISRKSRMTRRGAQKAVSRLAKAGLIVINRGRGRSNTNEFFITLPDQDVAPEDDDTTKKANDVHPPVKGELCDIKGELDDIKGELCDTKRRTPVHPNHQEPSETVSRTTNDAREAEFAEFWESVPRKVGKGQARKAYAAALKKTDAQTLLSAIRDYAECERVKRGYIQHPATWLNGEGWLDEPEQPLTPIDGGRHEQRTDNADRLQRIIRAAAEGSSRQDWG